MKQQHVWKLVVALLLACGLAQAQTITTFDAPGAGTASGQGTLGEGINPAGTIWGYDFESVANREVLQTSREPWVEWRDATESLSPFPGKTLRR
jgi:hypothetical protein